MDIGQKVTECDLKDVSRKENKRTKVGVSIGYTLGMDVKDNVSWILVADATVVL